VGVQYPREPGNASLRKSESGHGARIRTEIQHKDLSESGDEGGLKKDEKFRE